MPACAQGMTVASSQTERLLLQAPQAGATWTRARLRKHRISDLAACPYYAPPPGDGGPSPMGLPALAYAAGRLAPAGAGRHCAFVGVAPPVGVAGMLAGDGAVASGVGPTGGGGSSGAAHVPPLMHVSGGAISAHGSGHRGTSRRGRGPLGLCDCAQTPFRCAPGLPIGATGRRPTPPGATSSAVGVARRPAARVAVEASFAMALLQWASRLWWLPGPGHVT